MHSYLKAIGFSKLKNRMELEAIIELVVSKATEKKLVNLEDGTIIAELSMEFADDIGITVYGEYDTEKKFHVEHYFPYFKGKNISTKEEIYISKRVDTDSYTGMCDDYRLGVSLIFYLQNILDYLERRKRFHGAVAAPVALSGLATEGRILLPVEKNDVQIRNSKTEIKNRIQLIAEAKQGNQEAMDNLTIDDIDLYAKVSKRIQQEDIYSIVDTSFIPYGSESDNYTIIGIIISCKSMLNIETKEELYTLELDCNNMYFEVCINKSNLLGEPKPGRRFKGNVWLQGRVEF